MCKKFISFMTAAMMMISSTTVFADSSVLVKVNGEMVEFDQPPVIENGRTLIPFRGVLEKMGITVDWVSDDKTVICTDDEKIVFLPIGQTEMTVVSADEEIIDFDGKIDGEKISLDVPGKIINGRTLVPIRAVAESFNADVNWDSETKTVEINTSSDADVNMEELEKKTEDFSKIILLLSENVNNLDDVDESEFNEMSEELQDFYDNVLTQEGIYESQDKIDEITEKLEYFINRFKDFLVRNGIDVEN